MSKSKKNCNEEISNMDIEDVSANILSEEEVKRRVAQNKKRKIKNVVIFATIGVVSLSTVNLVRNRKPKIDASNTKIIEFISDNTLIDETLEQYNSATSDLSVDETNCIGNIIGFDDDIMNSVDNISKYIDISDRMDKYKLNKIVSYKNNFRTLNPDEKKEISNMSYDDLVKLLDNFEKLGKVDYDDFSQEAIDYCSDAIKINYAKELIDKQLKSKGSLYLSIYSKLIIQGIVINDTNLSVDKYDDIVLDDVDDGREYQVSYYEPSLDNYYNVELSDKYLKNMANYNYFFKKYSDEDNVSFDKFKKTARKAINDGKIVLLKDYEIKKTLFNQTIDYTLDSNTSNSEVRKLAKKIGNKK